MAALSIWPALSTVSWLLSWVHTMRGANSASACPSSLDCPLWPIHRNEHGWLSACIASRECAPSFALARELEEAVDAFRGRDVVCSSSAAVKPRRTLIFGNPRPFWRKKRLEARHRTGQSCVVRIWKAQHQWSPLDLPAHFLSATKPPPIGVLMQQLTCV